MKTVEWATPNRMKFDSQHKTFNRQVSSISRGNVWGSTQHSSFIRPSSETNCNGFESGVGHLKRYDLEVFYKIMDRWHVDEASRLVDENNGGILYAFFHYNGSRRIYDGGILTTRDYKLIRRFYVGNWKQQSIVDESCEYLTVN
jgi:hypothetical protein